jgi:type I restriction enzyme S subunit
MISRQQWPPQWQIVTLGELSKLVQYGCNVEADENGTGPVFIRISDIDDSGNLIQGIRKRVKHYDESLIKYILRPGDIVIARSGSIGRPYLYRETDGPAVFASYLIRFELDTDWVSPEYLMFYLRSQFFLQYLERIGHSVAQPNVNSKELSACKIPLPPRAEQERIVAILKKVDEIRQQRRDSLQAYMELKRLLFKETFSLSRPTKTIKLGDITEFATSGSRDWSRFYSSSETDPVFIRVQNIKNGRLDFSDIAHVTPHVSSETERARLQPKDIVVSITGTIGLAAVVPDDIGEGYVSQHVALVRTDGSIPRKFLVEYINRTDGGQQQIMKSNYGQTKPGLNLNQIRDLRIPVYGDEAVTYFLNALEKAETLGNAAKEHYMSLGRLYNEILTTAFDGDLTASWREAHLQELQVAAHRRDEALGIKRNVVTIKEFAPEHRPWMMQTERMWLKDQMSELQYEVWSAMRKWKGTVIPSERLDEFMKTWPTEHLENAKEQVLRALNQLAGLGLIAKIAVPNEDGEYLTGFRGFREEEFSRSTDLEVLGET